MCGQAPLADEVGKTRWGYITYWIENISMVKIKILLPTLKIRWGFSPILSASYLSGYPFIIMNAIANHYDISSTVDIG